MEGNSRKWKRPTKELRCGSVWEHGNGECFSAYGVGVVMVIRFRKVGVDQLNRCLLYLCKKFGFILVSCGELSKILKQGVILVSRLETRGR